MQSKKAIAAQFDDRLNIIVPQGMSIYDFCPVQHPADDKDSDIITTHFEYHSMESNLLKLDILGHDDPSMLRMLEDVTDQDIQMLYGEDRVKKQTGQNSERLTKKWATVSVGAGLSKEAAGFTKEEEKELEDLLLEFLMS